MHIVTTLLISMPSERKSLTPVQQVGRTVDCGIVDGGCSDSDRHNNLSPKPVEKINNRLIKLFTK